MRMMRLRSQSKIFIQLIGAKDAPVLVRQMHYPNCKVVESTSILQMLTRRCGGGDEVCNLHSRIMVTKRTSAEKVVMELVLMNEA